MSGQRGVEERKCQVETRQRVVGKRPRSSLERERSVEERERMSGHKAPGVEHEPGGLPVQEGQVEGQPVAMAIVQRPAQRSEQAVVLRKRGFEAESRDSEHKHLQGVLWPSCVCTVRSLLLNYFTHFRKA